MPALERIAVRFEEAIAYLRDRLAISESDWLTLLRSATAVAEQVVDSQAEAMGRDMLAAISEIYEDGGTNRDFRERYTEISEQHGWRSAGGPGWHSDLIWRMETFGARAAGRWEQAQRLARARPGMKYYFRYVTVDDHRVRKTHANFHGIILPIDHPFWLTHFPPNGFNCRCQPMLISERDLIRYGWAVTADTDPRLAVPPDDGFANNLGLAWAQLRGEPLQLGAANSAPRGAP